MSRPVMAAMLAAALVVGTRAEPPTLLDAMRWRNEAEELHAAGDTAKAIPLQQRWLDWVAASPIYGEGSEQHATALNSLALLYHTAARYADAEPLYRRSLAIREAKLGRDHPDTAISLINLAELYRDTGRYADAEPLYRRSLAIIEKNQGRNHPDAATVLNNLALLYQETARYADAEPLFHRSVAINEATQGRDHPDTAKTLHNLAQFFQRTGRQTDAEPLYRRSLAILEAKQGVDHPETAAVVTGLAMVFEDIGRFADAERLFRRCIAICETKLGRDHPHTALALINLAHLYQDTGRSADAESLYRRSIDIVEAKLGPDHPDTAIALNALASLYGTTGRHVDAEPLLRRSLAIYETTVGIDHPGTARTLNSLALVQARHQPHAAAATVDLARRRAARLPPALGERDRPPVLHLRNDGHAHLAYSLGLQSSHVPGLAEQSAAWLVNGKAAAAQTFAQAALVARDSRDPAIAQAVRELQDGCREQARLALATPPPGQEAAHQTQRDATAARNRTLASQLRQRGVRVAADDPWVDLAAVRAGLPQRAVFIDIARFDACNFQHTPGEPTWQPARYAAWLTPKAGPVAVIDLGPVAAIDAAVQAVRAELDAAPRQINAAGEPAAEKAARDRLAALATLIVTPLRDHLDAADRWVISPDAALWLVPWAALPLDDTTYAVERHAIQLVVSGRDLVPRAAIAATAGPTVFADPAFAAGPRLPATAAEAATLAERLRTTFGHTPAVVTAGNATPAAFQALDRPRFLTVATRGFARPTPEPSADECERLTRDPAFKPATPVDDPLLRCGLRLAGGDATGRDILAADLRGCQLVVLSAADVRTGDGVATLRHAFQLAGADAVLASLWPVPDPDAARLLAATLDAVGTGQGRADALRAAQRARIAARRERVGAAHPFGWAALTLTGDAGPLAE